MKNYEAKLQLCKNSRAKMNILFLCIFFICYCIILIFLTTAVVILLIKSPNFLCIELMANIEKPKFNIIDVSGNSYLFQCLDLELHLQGQGLVEILIEDGDYTKKDEANALIFIRRHLLDALKTQYLQVRQPFDLWKRLKEWYDHTKTVMLPQTQYDWQHLRLQDFKSVSEYNYALFDIVFRLELCGVKLTEVELLEKTFSTFHVSNILLQQQYMQYQFKTYFELISMLLIDKQINQLLLKNHDLRPTSAKEILEANANEIRNTSRFRSYGR